MNVGAYVYWESGGFIGRKKIFLDRNTLDEGTLMDGRIVKFINGKWVIPDEKDKV